jgi:hypothetical protein
MITRGIADFVSGLDHDHGLFRPTRASRSLPTRQKKIDARNHHFDLCAHFKPIARKYRPASKCAGTLLGNLGAE